MKTAITAIAIICWFTSVSFQRVATNRSTVRKPAMHTAGADTGHKPVYKPGAYHYQTYKKKDGAFGYEVFNGAKKIIRQDCIPGLPGNKGFATRTDASKVAALVVNKLQHNIFPPSITSEELRQLKVL